jgi:splicing factor 1
MAWRQQGSTGSNNIPLGNRRKFGGDSASPQRDDGGYNPSHPATGISENGYKRGRSPVRCKYPISSSLRLHTDHAPADEPSGDGSRRRKKRNRWGDATENKAAGLMGLPTAIMANMTSEQLEAYTLHLRIEEISQKLRIDDVVPADGDRQVSPELVCSSMLTPPRSPSPAPQYDNFGRRVNTREYRYRKRLEDERHKLIEKAMKVIPNYHPPQDYRRPTKTQEKVYVPVNDYPEINFSMIANPLTFLTFSPISPNFIYRVTLRGI